MYWNLAGSQRAQRDPVKKEDMSARFHEKEARNRLTSTRPASIKVKRTIAMY